MSAPYHYHLGGPHLTRNVPVCRKCAKRHWNLVSCEKHAQSLPRQPQWTPTLREGERLYGDNLPENARKQGEVVILREDWHF